MKHLTLGKPTTYVSSYDAGLLQAVPRQLNRTPIGIHEGKKLPFGGFDEWTGFELSWLNAKGLPQVAIAKFWVPVTSANLIESKSFKLYLNSFNDTQWQSWQQVQQQLSADLSACAEAPVEVKLFRLNEATELTGAITNAHCIDDQDLEITQYDYQPELLKLRSDKTQVQEKLHSDLLKSNCLITNQPDWGSIFIHYHGQAIDHAALLRYIVSFRHHNEFHEQCVERVFMDINERLQPEKLTVWARYTRRGGLDINPFRSNFESKPDWQRLSRQ